MDRNSLIGFGLLMLLLVAYIFLNQKTAPEKKTTTKKTDTTQIAESNKKTPLAKQPDTSVHVVQAVIQEQEITLENEDVEMTFTNVGAYPKKVFLKKFKTFDQKPLILFEGEKNNIDFEYSRGHQTFHSRTTGFSTHVLANNRSITFKDSLGGIEITYTLPEKGYMMDMSVRTNKVNTSQNIKLHWNETSLHTERDKTNEKLYTQVCYDLNKEGYDYYTIRDKKTENFDEGIHWLSFKQHFFNTTLVPEDGIAISGQVHSEPASDSSSKLLSHFSSTIILKAQDQLNFRWFNGPNDYDILKSYKLGMENIIPLSIYSALGFIKYINKWLIIPIFNFLSSLFSNYGVVILLLTFIIRLLMSPFTYKSYVSSAKMKALKPELDELKEKYAEDRQTYGVEQMKLYRQAGVNPLGGCLPALLQLPVFFALFSFFPHAIELRQAKFLWAEDLSTYDSILKLPFNIPMYGDHVSLFTILFVITSVLLALYSMNSATMDQSNPVLKYMPFIMPIMFLGIFNKMSSALTFYYFVSNLITLGLQVIIQNYIIDPNKIRAQIEAKKAEGPKESKFMQRMQQMQKQNEDRMKSRSQRRKEN